MEQRGTQQEEEISLNEILGLLWKNWRFILLLTGVFVVLALVISAVMNTQRDVTTYYEVETVFVVSEEEDYSDRRDLARELSKTDLIIENAIEEMDFEDTEVEDVWPHMEVERDSNDISIFLIWHDERDGVQFLDAIRDEVIDLLDDATDFAPLEVSQEAELTGTTEVDDQQVNITLNMVIAFVLGIMGSVFAIFLVNFMNPTVQSAGSLERNTGIPVLAEFEDEEEMPRWKKYITIRGV
ncbi:YveK family protein [Salisediminibacterium beveridgei]|uniref:Polysaccharide chain length determinant N-terminal domain-containing protein n=1 Tax=Salisediminibacterium beveridgei TaxID=632773 RepID=A0A1D7QRP3_9BACI|nr:Wzz/FepE/Etk N-terminal domain-containing protein [Salisediminibacterium beveridgei]AOM81677.1 hypothetical protein BBEV_0283 [Salisediminibacterium beveridgei]